MMISHKIVQSLPVTVEDIETAEKIFDPGVSSLKGRTKRQRPKMAVGDFIEITRELIENN